MQSTPGWSSFPHHPSHFLSFNFPNAVSHGCLLAQAFPLWEVEQLSSYFVVLLLYVPVLDSKQYFLSGIIDECV